MRKILSKKYLLKLVSRFVLLLLVLAPLTPKIGFSSDVVVYLHEIALICYIPLLIILRPSSLVGTSTQKAFLFYISTIAISSYVYIYLDVIEISGWMRLFKLIIYIAVPSLVVESKLDIDIFKMIIYVGIVAMTLNFLIVMREGQAIVGGQLLFDANKISEGLSGRYYNLNSNTIETTGRLSHGVWATYCSLLFAISSALICIKRISIRFYAVFLLLFILNLSVSISREGLLLTFVTSLGFCYKYVQNMEGCKKTLSIYRVNLLIVVIGIGVFFLKGSQIGQKISYMIDFISSGGIDYNIIGRLNTWKLTLYAVSENPLKLLFGFGYNLDRYGATLDNLSIHLGTPAYSHVPESLMFSALAFGGLMGVLALLTLFCSFYWDFRRAIMPVAVKSFLGFFFFGLLITNITSGATAMSDLVMLHLFLLIGIWSNEKSSTFPLVISEHVEFSSQQITLYNL